MGKIVGLTFDREFNCPVCGKSYRREADLRKHIEKEHPDPPANPPADNGGNDK